MELISGERDIIGKTDAVDRGQLPDILLPKVPDL